MSKINDAVELGLLSKYNLAAAHAKALLSLTEVRDA